LLGWASMGLNLVYRFGRIKGCILSVAVSMIITNVHADLAFQILYKFFPSNSFEYPYGRLAEVTDGNFYGVTTACCASHGSLFRITPGGNLTTLYSFTVSNAGVQGVVRGDDG